MTELKNVLHYYLPYKPDMTTSAQGRSAYITSIKRRLNKVETLTPELFDVMIFLRRKPILIPLSDAINELSEFIYDTQAESFDSKENAKRWFKIVMHQPLELPFYIFEKALSLHCDLFGLIDSGQAIEK